MKRVTTLPLAVALTWVIALGCTKQVPPDEPDGGGTFDAAADQISFDGPPPFDAGAADSPPDYLCGNGVLDDGEGCDDNNRLPFDGCSHLCQVECTTSCAICTPGVCMGTATCGDGIRADLEACCHRS